MLCNLLMLAACSRDKVPADPGDPVPNARAGLVALYSGDRTGVSKYFCDEIVDSTQEIAATAAAGQGSIQFGNARLIAAPEKLSVNWTSVRLTGRYSIWLNDIQEVRDTAEIGEVLIYMKIEDGAWKICDFGSDGTPAPN